MTQNIMDTVINESDEANIKHAIHAFKEYLICKEFYIPKKEEAQQEIAEIDRSIKGAKSNVEKWSVSEKAIQMAEELKNRNNIDRLFIHFVTSPTAQTYSDIKDGVIDELLGILSRCLECDEFEKLQKEVREKLVQVEPATENPSTEEQSTEETEEGQDEENTDDSDNADTVSE